MLAAVACHATPKLSPSIDRVEGLPACESPTPGPTWTSWNEQRIDSSTVAYSSNAPAAVPEGFRVATLAGAYRFVIAVTANSNHDSVAHGTLRLQVRPLPEVWARLQGMYPLSGWSDIDLARIGPLAVAHSVADRNSRRPGAEVVFDSATRQLKLTLGNSMEFRADGSILKTTDVGVMLYAFYANEHRIVGQWKGGGMSSKPPEGYFCADRVTQ